MSAQNGLFVVVALCRGGCRFFAVCFKLHFSTFTMKTNEKQTKKDTLGSLWWSGSSSCPRRAVRIGFSRLIRLCLHRCVFYSQSPRQGGLRNAVLWSRWLPAGSSEISIFTPGLFLMHLFNILIVNFSNFRPACVPPHKVSFSERFLEKGSYLLLLGSPGELGNLIYQS